MPGSTGTPASSFTVAGLGERAILDRIRARVPPAPSWVRVGIGDDAAVIEPARNTLDVLTADALIEGVHFDRRFSSARDVGYRALAVNLSDLAAMGATPRAALLSLGLPPGLPIADLDDLLEGFLDAARPHGLSLVGGNVTASPGPLIVDVTATGAVRRRRVLTRAGAHAGDELYVSGVVGAAAAGLAWLRAQADGRGSMTDDPTLAACAERYRIPEARVRLGLLAGRNRAASACVDLSDGLADGVRQICSASGVGAVVEADAIPIDAGGRRWFEARQHDPIVAAITGGDDYELLFAVPRRARRRFLTIAKLVKGLAVTRIGAVTADTAIVLRREGSTEPLPSGFAHFAEGP